MDVIIRPAEARDVPQMLALVQELALFERAPNEVTVTLEHMRDAGFGPDPVWVGWVAETVHPSVPSGSAPLPDATSSAVGKGPRDVPTALNGILGMAVCYERYSTWKGRRLYLEDIIVTERARGLRIGEKLFKECAAHAVAKGYSGMLWQVLDWNVNAIRFYDRFGTTYSREWLNGSLDAEQLKAIAASR